MKNIKKNRMSLEIWDNPKHSKKQLIHMIAFVSLSIRVISSVVYGVFLTTVYNQNPIGFIEGLIFI